LNPRPLGYEPYDVCLCRLAQSPVTTLTSMDWRREVAFGPLRIARLKPSRSVWFTNRFTEPYESRSGREPGPADGPGGELSLYLARRRVRGLRP